MSPVFESSSKTSRVARLETSSETSCRSEAAKPRRSVKPGGGWLLVTNICCSDSDDKWLMMMMMMMTMMMMMMMMSGDK